MRSAVAVVLLVVAALSGCGHEAEATSEVAGPENFQLQFLLCSDWEDASPAFRAKILHDMKQVLGGEVIGIGYSGRGNTLSRARATTLFNDHCSRPGSDGFLLYKLYGQAAGFTSHLE